MKSEKQQDIEIYWNQEYKNIINSHKKDLNNPEI